ncbi:hypothetical protein SAMN05216259_11018 [Actinacidiphila guanduensis]|uniref:Lipoprotein n=2 Tax=Actinacidiphila guanduensis TaxID=310781 RepID=A0A1H0JWB1_9ACTN|nr:hypothetical protein SAMN05216259_11018 [Actinacidiphila guanduensis]
MSGRAWRFPWAATAALALLAGCSIGSHSDAKATAAPSGASAPPPVGSIDHPRPVPCADGMTFRDRPDPLRGFTPSPNSATSTSAPPDSPTDSPNSGTASASPRRATPSSPSGHASGAPSRTSHPRTSGTASPSSGAGDIVVGPLTWHGLADLTGGDQHDHGIENGGGWHYRVDSLVQPDSVVTVTVGATERARAGLEFGGEYGAPTPAVTFHACPDGATSFLGAFFVAGDGRACVPIDVRVGNGPARHVVISFFNGRCPA